MKLINCKFEELSQRIKSKKLDIAIFGIGVIGVTVTRQILCQNNIEMNVKYFIDNDSAKWGKKIEVGNNIVPIVSIDILKNCSEKLIVLLAVSRFMGILDQMEGIENTNNIECYIVPMMCVEEYVNNSSRGMLTQTMKENIPKKIHYMWLGKNKIPDTLIRCIDSWKKYCSDYEIIRWDESNYDVEKCQYMREAYADGKYGFVPDYARLDILYKHGGIYLDTDVELLKSLDDLLYQEAFCSVEKWQVINFGGCSGAVKGHPAIKTFLEAWSVRQYYREDGSPDPISSGIIDTQVAINHGYVINGENQNILGMNIYTYDYFHPYDYMSGNLHITDNTYSIHHFNGGWLTEEAKKINEQTMHNYDKVKNRCVQL